jgi:transposase InsO family protein
MPLRLPAITALLREAGGLVNKKQVERIWRREGFKVPQKQPKKARLGLNDGSCIRVRPEYPNHVWSYDFVEDRTHVGRKFRMLNIIDEFTYECLAVRVSRKPSMGSMCSRTSSAALLSHVLWPGVRGRSGPGMGCGCGRQDGLHEPGCPWENDYCESFNAKLRDELLKVEIFYTLEEATIIIESWRQHYNTVRPHSSLGCRPPAPEDLLPASKLAPRPTLN